MGILNFVFLFTARLNSLEECQRKQDARLHHHDAMIKELHQQNASMSKISKDSNGKYNDISFKATHVSTFV